MKVKAKCEIDILKLFLHDKFDCGPFSQQAIADYLTQKLSDGLRQIYARIEVVTPREGGLDRFVIKTVTWTLEETMYSRRCHNFDELADHLPDDIYRTLERLNEEKAVLSEEKS